MAAHTIFHVEIPAADRGEAVRFYRDVFGWDAKDVPDIPYPMFTAGAVTGGFPDIDGRYKSGDIVVSISSDDIKADLKAIEAAGGQIVEGPYDLGPAGVVAFFKDPTGNRLLLFQEPADSGRITPDGP